MAKVRMYCTYTCPYCRMALRLLQKKKAQVERVQVDEVPERRQEMVQVTGRTSVPQIFIGDRHVGGYAELAELDMEGELDNLLMA